MTHARVIQVAARPGSAGWTSVRAELVGQQTPGLGSLLGVLG